MKKRGLPRRDFALAALARRGLMDFVQKLNARQRAFTASDWQMPRMHDAVQQMLIICFHRGDSCPSQLSMFVGDVQQSGADRNSRAEQKIGGARARAPDLLIANEALSQRSYGPTLGNELTSLHGKMRQAGAFVSNKPL